MNYPHFDPKQLDAIKKLRFKKPIEPDWQKKIDGIESGPFADFSINMPAPPPNDSLKTLEELKYLSNLPDNKKYVIKYDDIKKSFADIFDYHNIKFPKNFVNKIMPLADGVIMKFKYDFKRPRPRALAKLYGVDLGEEIVMDSMNTPSYPSGHSTQGYFLGLTLAQKYPDLEEELMLVAKNISKSRQIARAHFPSDSTSGIMLGKKLYNHLYE